MGVIDREVQKNPPVWDHRPIRVSSIRMTPVELPYVPILLNETFITALWDTGAERNLLFRRRYTAIIFHTDSSKDERQSRDSTMSPVQSFG
ncbi:hypothetical protein TNCV_3540611 [Trichonephila clavipes]|nr:hypothetical protein TNCV_3540611 [Trichonephila clavipes]